jgi:hypothetical protein
MNDDTHGGVDTADFTLSIDSHLELLALRDSLLAMARTIYGPTAEGSLRPVPNLTAAQLGHVFEHIAFQIHGVLTAATPTDRVMEEPSPLH